MNNIKTFENFNNVPTQKEMIQLVDSVSSEFWKMTRLANWNEIIKHKYDSYNDTLNDIKKRLYKKYDTVEIGDFKKEYDELYDNLYKYLEKYWLGRPGYDVTDDGYSDLLSSIIGKGKLFIKRVIKDPKIPIDMVKKDDYAENFGYLLDLYWDEDIDNAINIYYDIED